MSLDVDHLHRRAGDALALVRLVFGRTVETRRGDGDALIGHFHGRLDAIARTQAIAARTGPGTADLEDLVREELLSVGAVDGPHVRIGGPVVTLPAATVDLIALALHELTTNALKFGALRVAGATLAVTWAVERDGAAARLRLDWREGGVAVPDAARERRGFGRELVEEMLPHRLGATSVLAFGDEGVACVVMVPL